MHRILSEVYLDQTTLDTQGAISGHHLSFQKSSMNFICLVLTSCRLGSFKKSWSE